MDGYQMTGLWFMAVNALAFALMGVDKYKAQRGLWRIPEWVLFFFPLLGGTLGAIAGMGFFAHKTKHRRFSAGLPVLLILQLAAVGGGLWLWKGGVGI